MYKEYLLAAGLVCYGMGAGAQTLDEISRFAGEICGDIPEGTYTKTTIKGAIEANAGLFSNLVGISGSASPERITEAYKGIPFDKLPDSIPTASMCKSELAKILIERRKEAHVLTCRRKDFGQAGWNRSESFEDTSDWMGGGHDQKWWCNRVANAFIKDRSIGSSHQVKTVKSSEESDKDWKGHVTYKYHCTVSVKWDPLWKEKTDPVCGVEYY